MGPELAQYPRKTEQQFRNATRVHEEKEKNFASITV